MKITPTKSDQDFIKIHDREKNTVDPNSDIIPNLFPAGGNFEENKPKPAPPSIWYNKFNE